MTLKPRPSRTFPFKPSSDVVSAGTAVVAVLTIISLLSVVFYNRYLYFEAGVRNIDLLAALAGLVAVLGTFAGAALLWRRGFSGRLVVAVTGAGVVLAVGLSLLPPLAAGSGWLTVVLSVLVSLVCFAVLSGWVLGAALYMPLPWDTLAESEGFEPSAVSPAPR